MQPTLCARCHKNMAVIFITKIENNQSQNEGLCLSCAREMHIKPVDDIISKMGLTDEDLESLSGGDALGQPLGDGGLAHARLADETGVVLLAAVEDLDNAFQLLAPADHLIQLAVPGPLGQGQAVVFQKLFLVAPALAVGLVRSGPRVGAGGGISAVVHLPLGAAEQAV